MSPHRMVTVLLLCLAGSACVSHRQYRATLNPIPAITVEDLEQRNNVDDGSGSLKCSELLFRERSIEKFRAPNGEVFTLGVIELSDDGHVKDVRQRDEVFRELKLVARGGLTASASSPGAVVVTFVHGWHHQAKVCDENLCCFRRAMEGLVMRKADRANKGPVFGLYIGWRGESAHQLSALTFYDRKSAAQHVGALAGRDLLLELSQMQHELDAEVRTASGGARYVNMVTVGHSFGGALVYSAMESLKVSEYATKHGVGYPACNGLKPVREGIGDLVILVNPAFEAWRYRYFAEDVAAAGNYALNQRPILLTVASTADLAVGVAFPAGRALWLMWHPSAWGRGRAQITGLGHYEPYTTHQLTFAGKTETPQSPTNLTDESAIQQCGLADERRRNRVRETCNCTYPFDVALMSGALAGRSESPELLKQGQGTVHALRGQDVSMQPIAGKAAVNAPFIVATAPPNLISGHNDIYNPNFVMFLIGYINGTLPGAGPPKPAIEDIPTCQ
jgi:hypothetical protein